MLVRDAPVAALGCVRLYLGCLAHWSLGLQAFVAYVDGRHGGWGWERKCFQLSETRCGERRQTQSVSRIFFPI